MRARTQVKDTAAKRRKPDRAGGRRRKTDAQTTGRLARLYAALNATNEAILRARSPETLYRSVCNAAVYGGKFVAAAVLLPDPRTNWMRLVAVTGRAERLLRRARISVDQTIPEGRGLVGTAHRTGTAVVCDDVPHDPRTQPWHALARRIDVVSSAAVPLRRGTQAVGVLLFCARTRGAFGAETLALLERLAENIAFALEHFEHEAQRLRTTQRLHESEERYRTILESIDDAYYEVDLEGNLVFCNNAFCRMLGRDFDELRGLNNRTYQTPAVAADIFRVFNQVYRTGAPTRSHIWSLIRKDGSNIAVEGSVQLVRDAGGRAAGFRGILRDVAARLEMERRLRESEARFRALTELSSDWYWEQDTEFRFTRVESQRNDAVRVRELLLGKCGWETAFEIDIEGGWKAHRALCRAHQPFRDVVMHLFAADGKRYYISVSGEPVFADDGRFCGYRGVTREITEQKIAEERVQYLATHDALTGLPNRDMFSRLLNLAIDSARRYSRRFAVLFIDLDRFKIINDTLGHDAGDLLLKEMAIRLKDSLRASDVVARLGGDEFVVLLHEISEVARIAAVARKLLTAAIKPMDICGRECRVTASIGVCRYPQDGENEQTLMKRADSAMYLAKDEGKNNFQFYTHNIKTQSLERLALETNLRRALERQEFSLHYQAKFSLKTERITGAEALLRWRNPEFGVVRPAQFIPVAEETGLIVPIGRWVLHTACAQNVAWQRQGLPPTRIAVNLSARQFGDPSLLTDIREALAASGMPAELLELEITESMVTQTAARTVRLLADIRRMGVHLAIDDFGTGYSSLAQLKRFPIDTLKIDRSFVRDIPADAEDKAITEAIIALSKTLNLTVVAEGVETVEQKDFLRVRGCDEVQGYHFSRPVPADAFAELLRRHAPQATSNAAGAIR